MTRHPLWWGTALTVVLAGPALLLIEDWHGYPLIDHHGHGWWVAAGVVLAIYAAGGAIAGRGSTSAGRAVGRAVALVGLTMAVFVPADLVRRIDGARNFLTLGVTRLWCNAALGALVAAALGALVAAAWRRRRAAPLPAGAQSEPEDLRAPRR